LLSASFYDIVNQNTISGIVTDGASNLPWVRVRVKATDIFTTSDYYGKFSLTGITTTDTLIVTAWADGYYNGETHAVAGDTGIIIQLHPLPTDDNPDYQWLSPEPDSISELNCGNCHATVLMNQWSKNAHANSATNPFFLAMYYGTDLEGNPDIGVGYKQDFEQTRGNCATCHIPGAAVHDPWGIDPNSVTGVSRRGVFCDFCHKMYRTLPSTGQGTTGVLSIELLRPFEGNQVFFGPYDDIHEPDAYLPLIRRSEFCAPCHIGKFWGTEAYNSFDEWKNSPYPAMGIECQTCHMYPDSITTHFVFPEKGGFERNPLTIPSHLQPGSRDPQILANSLTMDISVVQESDSIVAMVTLFNDQTGHHVPTDRPSRNMILLIDAVSETGEKLEFIGGKKVPWWGGIGEVSDGNFYGLPGKGFAKILEDFNGNAPSPSWRPSHILSDNRIAAFDTDTSFYYFKAPATSSRINVTAKLIYRRFFKETMKEKGFEIDDILMEHDSVALTTESFISGYQPNTAKDINLKVYPNPFTRSTRLNITLFNSKGSVQIEIFDGSGKLIKSLRLDPKIDKDESILLDFSGYKSGFYFCRINTMNNSKTILLIKE
jgi:hypothetical protein